MCVCVCVCACVRVCVCVRACVSAHDTKGVDRVEKRQVRTIKIRVKVFGTDGEESSSSAHVHTVRHGHTKAVRISLQSHIHSYSKEIRSKGERLVTRDTEQGEKGGEQERQR